MKHVFIVNPVSGKADASLYLVPRLIDAAAGAGVDYAVELTQHAGHAAEIAGSTVMTGNRCAFTPAAGTVL